MVLEIDRQDESRWHFALATTDKWIIGLILGVLFSVLGYIGHQFSSQMENLRGRNDLLVETMQRVVIQQAVTNAQMGTLSSQLADVPGMAKAIIEVKIRGEDNTRRIGDLEQLRNLKR